jgi:hypothetical protein
MSHRLKSYLAVGFREFILQPLQKLATIAPSVTLKIPSQS